MVETSDCMEKRTVVGNCILTIVSGQLEEDLFFLCDYESSKVKLTAPLFYLEVVKALAGHVKM